MRHAGSRPDTTLTRNARNIANPTVRGVGWRVIQDGQESIDALTYRRITKAAVAPIHAAIDPKSRISKNNWPTTRVRDAPSALRTDSSGARSQVRANTSVATWLATTRRTVTRTNITADVAKSTSGESFVYERTS